MGMRWIPQANGRSTAVTTEPWATLQEVADHLKVSEDTVHRWIATRAMPSHRIGRVWRFKRSDVDEWVRSGSASDSKDRADQHEGHR
jgi:excisionase family DNA binding protein